MKILHILPGLYTGGGEKICIEICNELAKDSDNEVVLCSLEPLTDRQNIMFDKISPLVSFMTLNKKGKNPAIFFEVINMVRSVKPDVIHTHLRALHYSALAIIFSGKPNIHTIPTVAQKEASSMMLKLYTILYRYFNFDPVSMGERVFASCKKIYGDKCTSNIDIGTIPLEKSELYDEVTAEFEGLKKDENTKFFVSVGRLYAVKNQLLLIESFLKLLKEGYDAHLFVIGSTLIDPKYAKQCEDLVNGNKNIHIIGEKSNVTDYLSNADALCFSSIYEGLPMTIVEAMSIGKPTIVTPVGGMPDLIDEGVNGYISDDMSVDSYLKVFKKIVKNDPLDYQKIKDIYSEQYSIEQCTKKYFDLYKKHIEDA